MSGTQLTQQRHSQIDLRKVEECYDTCTYLLALASWLLGFESIVILWPRLTKPQQVIQLAIDESSINKWGHLGVESYNLFVIFAVSYIHLTEAINPF